MITLDDAELAFLKAELINNSSGCYTCKACRKRMALVDKLRPVQERVGIKGVRPPSIDVEFERDASLRGTEVVIVNYNRGGVECQGLQMLCTDNGKILWVRGPVDLVEGVDIS